VVVLLFCLLCYFFFAPGRARGRQPRPVRCWPVISMAPFGDDRYSRVPLYFTRSDQTISPPACRSNGRRPQTAATHMRRQLAIAARVLHVPARNLAEDPKYLKKNLKKHTATAAFSKTALFPHEKTLRSCVSKNNTSKSLHF